MATSFSMKPEPLSSVRSWRKRALTVALLSALTGCAAFPDDYEEEVGVPNIVKEYQDSWSHEKAIEYVPSTSGASIQRYFTLPSNVANQRVALDLNLGADAKVGDLIYTLQSQGYPIVSRLKESENDVLEITRFNGTLGQFVDRLSQIQNIAYEYRNDTLFIVEANRYSVSLPQHEELLLQVAASLMQMGAFDVRTDILAGMVHFEAKPDISDYVTEYLDRIAQNSAMVRLQVAVVTVGLNRDLSRGLDWSQIMAKTGTRDMRPVDTGGDSYLLGQALSFAGGTGGGVAYAFNSNRFSLSAIVRALSEFGNARTEQNVVLGTVSGMPVRISSGNEIPYIKKIGSSTASGGSISGSTDTEIVKSGLELKITPNFDSSDTSVVTTVEVNMSSLVGFRELSAGNALGTLSQPEMQNLEFENVGRLRAGETIVIGGITYDQMSDNYTNLPGLERMPTGSRSRHIEKNAIYIVIRPTVIVFTQNAQELAEQRKRAASGDVKIKPVDAPAAPRKATPAPSSSAPKTNPFQRLELTDEYGAKERDDHQKSLSKRPSKAGLKSNPIPLIVAKRSELPLAIETGQALAFVEDYVAGSSLPSEAFNDVAFNVSNKNLIKRGQSTPAIAQEQTYAWQYTEQDSYGKSQAFNGSTDYGALGVISPLPSPYLP